MSSSDPPSDPPPSSKPKLEVIVKEPPAKQPRTVKELFKWAVKHTQQSSFILAIIAIVGIATWAYKARDLVREWTREVIKTEVVDSQDFHSKESEGLVKNSTFVDKVDERAKAKLDQALAQKEFWDKVEAAAKGKADESARDEVNKSDANRIAKLADSMLGNEAYRTIVVSKLVADPTLRKELVAALVRDPVAMERFRGPQGVQGVQGTQGQQGIQGVQGLTGPEGKQGTEGKPGVCPCPVTPPPANTGG